MSLYSSALLLIATAALMSSASQASVLTSRDPPSTYGAWTSIGCWGDNTTARTLHHGVGSSASNTVETCLDTCAAGGFALGGVEYGSECYCGNAILYNYGLSPECNYACSGNSEEICGGSGTINIYQNGNQPYTVGPASALPSYDGWHGYSDDVYEGLCYTDNLWTISSSLRLLRFHPNVAIPLEEMSVQVCVDGCRTSGYTAAGLEYGQECWCDSFHKFPIGDNRPNSECSMPCTDNATEFCGGADRVLVYTN